MNEAVQRAAMQDNKAENVFFIDPTSESCSHQLVGGKARNLWLLGRMVTCKVPPWFCITTEAFGLFVEVSTGTLFVSPPFPLVIPVPPHSPPSQENALRDFLHVDPAQLKASTAEICARVMATPIPTVLR